MHLDRLDAAAQAPIAAQFESIALDVLARAVAYDVAFIGLRGASMTARGLPQDAIDHAVRPGSVYEAELAPVKEAASFLEASRESWDIIVVDAYDGDELAEGMAGRAFFRALRQRLRPGGAFAFNVVGTLDGSGPVRSVARAATAELDDVRILPVMTPSEKYDRSERRNVVVVGVG